MAISNLSNKVYTWGQGINGQLGSKRDQLYIPTLIEVFAGTEIVKGYNKLNIN